MTFYGGFLLSFFSGFIYLKIKKEKSISYLNICVPSAFLALAIGRIGCFMNGDDYGIAANLISSAENPWWAVRFNNHAEKIPRVPTQLMESFGALIFVIFFYQLERKKRVKNIGVLAILFYGIFRFFLEFLRDDYRGSFGIFSTSQIVSLTLIFFSLVFFNRKLFSKFFKVIHII